jgi:hypothetical protein
MGFGLFAPFSAMTVAGATFCKQTMSKTVPAGRRLRIFAL